jgi:rSAM/selenodomain-associated transferase 2
LKLSVIIPVLNEAAIIGEFVRHLRTRLPDAELIIVDGGSTDDTRDQLRNLRDEFSLHLLRTPRGRAFQMNAGARLATGDTLLFLHADSHLPDGAWALIEAALSDPTVCGGCFRLHFPRSQWIYRISDSLGNIAVDLFRIALGDHGIFCRKKIFFFAGGYPDVPLMEDAEFYRRLNRFGRVRQLAAAIESSPRRYEELGPYRTTALYISILALYLARVSPHFLSRYYEQVTVATASTPRRQHETLTSVLSGWERRTRQRGVRV